MDDRDQYIHLKEISVNFIQKRPKSNLELVFKDDSGVERKSDEFTKRTCVQWDLDIYVRAQTSVTLTIQRALFSQFLIGRFAQGFAEISITLKLDEFRDDKTVSLEDSGRRVTVNFVCGRSKSLADLTRILGSQACTALASKVNMLDGLDKILGFLQLPQLASPVAQLNPVAAIVVSIVNQVIVNLKGISECHKQLVILMDDLVSMLPIMYSALEAIEVAEHRELVRKFIEFVKETSEHLNKYASPSTSAFLLKNWYKSNKGEVDALREKSARLKQNVDLAISVDIKEQQRIANEQQHLANEQQRLAEEQRTLGRIRPPAGSSFDPDPKNCCMQDTRASLIEKLISFAVSEDTSQRLFLLSGIAGSGKSSVATSVAKLLYQRNCLLGSFFFQTDSEKMRMPANLLHMVSYSMAMRHESYKKALVEALAEDTMIEDQGPSIQFETLIRKPLCELLKTSSTSLSHPPNPSYRRAIVIDALDECDDPKSVSSYLTEIIALVPWLKVVVTSRPLDDIEADLCRTGYTTPLDLFIVDASEDILKFTQSRFAPGGSLHQPQSKVTEKDIQALAKKSHGLFIWIKVVLSYLDNFPFASAKLEEMKSILSSRTAASPEKELDQLYLRVLRNVAGSSLHYQNAVKNFVGLIYTTSRNKPLPCKGLHSFFPTRATPEDVRHLRSKLAALITIDPETKVLHVCHPSFLDFVASEARSQEFWTKPGELDAMMAERCLSILRADQKPDIGGQESNRQHIEETPVLEQRISTELQYSAVYWVDHLTRSQASETSDEKLIEACEFLYHGGLLHLLKVLNLFSEFNAAAQVLSKIINVISKTAGKLTHRLDRSEVNSFRIRILVIGRSGVGKSSLINCVFGINNARVEDHMSGVADIEREFVSLENQAFVLHDSKGFEPGDLSNFDVVRRFVLQRSRQELPLSKKIHALWLCTETPTAGGRVFEIGDEKLLQFAHENQLPLVIVFTQYDRLVRTKEMQLRGLNMDATSMHQRSVEDALETFQGVLESLKIEMDNLMIPIPIYVTVSVRLTGSWRGGVSSLLKVTRDMVEEQVKDDVLKLWGKARGASSLCQH